MFKFTRMRAKKFLDLITGSKRMANLSKVTVLPVGRISIHWHSDMHRKWYSKVGRRKFSSRENVKLYTNQTAQYSDSKRILPYEQWLVRRNVERLQIEGMLEKMYREACSRRQTTLFPPCWWWLQKKTKKEYLVSGQTIPAVIIYSRYRQKVQTKTLK